MEQQVNQEHLLNDASSLTDEQIIQNVLALAGCWSDLSWDEVERELERIRRESQPSSILEL